MNEIEIPGSPYVYSRSQQTTLDEIARRVSDLRAEGSLTPEVLYKIRKYFRIKNIYHSNAIEGNKLGLGETRQVVEMGMTLTGKSLKDQTEARNLGQATDFLEDLVSNPVNPIMERNIREIHYLVLKGVDDDNAGKYRTVPVEISGSEIFSARPGIDCGQDAGGRFVAGQGDCSGRKVRVCFGRRSPGWRGCAYVVRARSPFH